MFGGTKQCFVDIHCSYRGCLFLDQCIIHCMISAQAPNLIHNYMHMAASNTEHCHAHK